MKISIITSGTASEREHFTNIIDKKAYFNRLEGVSTSLSRRDIHYCRPHVTTRNIPGPYVLPQKTAARQWAQKPRHNHRTGKSTHPD
jgi:hypothetical protein